MNIMHMKYAVEVARLGSINRAAETLFIAQPNLSRYIRELETDLGISIFRRTPRGMIPTPEGETFIGYATQVLKQIDDIERLYKGDGSLKQSFSISVPRASYISDAFVKFTQRIAADPMKMYYMETDTRKTIRNLLDADYHLGIVRYAVEDDAYFKRMLDEKGIACQLVTDFSFLLVMSHDSPLAQKEKIYYSDLVDRVEIGHGDPIVPSISVNKQDEMDESPRSILLFGRGGQFDLLCENSETYMWVSPIPEKLLDRYNLAQRPCEDNQRIYRDVLIWRKNYTLTELDRQFITELVASKRRLF